MLHWLASIPFCRRISVLFAVCTIFVILPFTTAMAGGLYLTDFGSSSMGTAGAGSQAYANDASTARFNPAGMARIDGNQFGGAVGFIATDVQFDPDGDTPIDGGDGGSAGGLAPLAGFAYVHSVSGKLKLGVNVGTISGAALDYNSDWTGRYLNQEVSLTTVSFVPDIAYRINEKFSVGAGLNIMYGKLEMDIAIPSPLPGQPDGKVEVEDADDWDVGFQLGVLFELNEDTRLGAMYFSGAEPSFEGDARIIPAGLEAGIALEFTFPEAVRGSIYHKLNQKIALLGSVGWEKWSDFDKIPISVGDNVSAAIPTNWDDTWHISGGIHYMANEKWMFMTGVAYDTSPVDKADRTPDLPIDRQARVAFGTQYHWKENVDIGAAIVYVDLGDAAIKNHKLLGEYEDNDAIIVGFNFNWKL